MNEDELSVMPWKRLSDRKGGVIDRADPMERMIADGVDYLTPQPKTALILPACAHPLQLQPAGSLGEFTEFLPKLFGSKRYNDLVWRSDAELAWDSIILQRLQKLDVRKHPVSISSLERLRSQVSQKSSEHRWKVVLICEKPRSWDIDDLWGILGRARDLWRAKGDSPPKAIKGASNIPTNSGHGSPPIHCCSRPLLESGYPWFSHDATLGPLLSALRGPCSLYMVKTQEVRICTLWPSSRKFGSAYLGLPTSENGRSSR